MGYEKGRVRLATEQIDQYFDLLCSFSIVDKSILGRLISRWRAGEPLQLITDYLCIITGTLESDWDWINSQHTLDSSHRVIRERYLALDELRSPYNVGAIFRSAESFCIKKIYLLGNCASPQHPKSIRTSCGTVSQLEYEQISHDDFIKRLDTELKAIPVYALECRGEDIDTFSFSDKAIAIIGNEEFGISKPLLSFASHTLTIPTFGSKGSLNVSVATGILLSRWAACVL